MTYAGSLRCVPMLEIVLFNGSTTEMCGWAYAMALTVNLRRWPVISVLDEGMLVFHCLRVS